MLELLVAALLTVPTPIVAPDTIDACGLYTREEVAALAGETARKPRFFTVSPSTHGSCTTTSSTSKWTVKVYVEVAPTRDMLQMSLKALKGVVKDQTAQALKPVSGLGDEAYWGQIGPTNGQFHVVVGTALVSIQTFGKAAGAGTMEKTRPIADLVVQRYKARTPSSRSARDTSSRRV